MDIENINKYIVEEVYGGIYGEWIDYPKEYTKRTRRIRYIPIEMFGRKYKLIHQAMEFDYIEPVEKVENDNKRLPRRCRRLLSVGNNEFIEKYFEFAEIEYRNTNATKIIDNSKIKEMKDEYINYFNREIKEEVINVFNNRGIEIKNMRSYDDETLMEFDFKILNKPFNVGFDHDYFHVASKNFSSLKFNKFKYKLGFKYNNRINRWMIDDRIDREKLRHMLSQELDLLEQFLKEEGYINREDANFIQIAKSKLNKDGYTKKIFNKHNPIDIRFYIIKMLLFLILGSVFQYIIFSSWIKEMYNILYLILFFLAFLIYYFVNKNIIKSKKIWYYYPFFLGYALSAPFIPDKIDILYLIFIVGIMGIMGYVVYNENN